MVSPLNVEKHIAQLAPIVSRMRNVLVKFKEKFHEKYFDEALSYTWERALRFDIEEITRDDSWE